MDLKLNDENETFQDMDSILESRDKDNEFRKSSQYTDITLKTQDGTLFPAHKNILASSCAYFKAMLSTESQWQELNEEVVELKEDISGECLEMILEYIYTSKVVITSANALMLHEGAVYFGLNNLKRMITKFPIRNIKLETCLDLWRYGRKFFNDELSNKCVEYIVNNCAEFFDIYLLNLNFNELLEISSDKRSTINQELLVQNQIIWLKQDFAKRQQYATQLFAVIRMAEISNKFKATEILNDQILCDNKDFLKYMIHEYRELLLPSQMKSVKGLKPILLAFTKHHIYTINFENQILCPILELSLSDFLNVTTFADRRKVLMVSTDSTPNAMSGEYGKKFQFYCSKDNSITEFPVFNISEKCSVKLVTVQNRIYAVNSVNCNRLNIFDLDACLWFKGPNLLSQRSRYGFVSNDNFIYVIGGESRPTVEKFDITNESWSVVNEGTAVLGPTESVWYENIIYCFTKNGGKKFNTITNTFENDIVKAPYEWIDDFDVAVMNKECYVFGKTSNNGNERFCGFLYNMKENTWTDLEIEFPVANINYMKLVTIDVPVTFENLRFFNYLE